MTIDNKTIENIAKLSSLEICEEKKDGLKQELEEIVNFVENLNEIDVSHVEATFTTISVGAPLREDVAYNDSKLSQHIISHSPKSDEDGYFVVPAIIE